MVTNKEKKYRYLPLKRQLTNHYLLTPPTATATCFHHHWLTAYILRYILKGVFSEQNYHAQVDAFLANFVEENASLFKNYLVSNSSVSFSQHVRKVSNEVTDHADSSDYHYASACVFVQDQEDGSRDRK